MIAWSTMTDSSTGAGLLSERVHDLGRDLASDRAGGRGLEGPARDRRPCDHRRTAHHPRQPADPVDGFATQRDRGHVPGGVHETFHLSGRQATHDLSEGLATGLCRAAPPRNRRIGGRDSQADRLLDGIRFCRGVTSRVRRLTGSVPAGEQGTASAVQLEVTTSITQRVAQQDPAGRRARGGTRRGLPGRCGHAAGRARPGRSTDSRIFRCHQHAADNLVAGHVRCRVYPP